MAPHPTRPSADLVAEVSRLQALLSHPDFRRENLALLLEEAYPLIERLGAKPGPAWDVFVKDRVVPFAQKWRAWPSVDWGLFLPRRPGWDLGAILTGHWGALPVFPWTTDRTFSRWRDGCGHASESAIGTRRRITGRALALAGDEWDPPTRDPASPRMA